MEQHLSLPRDVVVGCMVIQARDPKQVLSSVNYVSTWPKARGPYRLSTVSQLVCSTTAFVLGSLPRVVM